MFLNLLFPVTLSPCKYCSCTLPPTPFSSSTLTGEVFFHQYLYAYTSAEPANLKYFPLYFKWKLSQRYEWMYEGQDLTLLPMFVCSAGLGAPESSQSCQCGSGLHQGLPELHLWVHLQQLPGTVQPPVPASWPTSEWWLVKFCRRLHLTSCQTPRGAEICPTSLVNL